MRVEDVDLVKRVGLAARRHPNEHAAVRRPLGPEVDAKLKVLVRVGRLQRPAAGLERDDSVLDLPVGRPVLCPSV